MLCRALRALSNGLYRGLLVMAAAAAITLTGADAPVLVTANAVAFAPFYGAPAP